MWVFLVGIGKFMWVRMEIWVISLSRFVFLLLLVFVRIMMFFFFMFFVLGMLNYFGFFLMM